MQRCKAKSKQSGDQCKNYAINGGQVCRMHGARGGPKTFKGLIRCKQAPMKYGFYCKEEQEELKLLRKLAKGDYNTEKPSITHLPICFSSIPEP